MKPVQILLCILLIIFIPISLANFIAKFVFSDCDPHLYFNKPNISFYQDTFTLSYAFSCINMIGFLFLTIYKLFRNNNSLMVIMISLAVLLCANLSWLVFEGIIIAHVPLDICFLRTINIIESSLGLIYANIIAIIFFNSAEKNISIGNNKL